MRCSTSDDVWQVSTKDELDALVSLDVFKYDPDYNLHEKEYEVSHLLQG
jgi:3',5'-cyclic AMP phosphodiesterase CpdA